MFHNTQVPITQQTIGSNPFSNPPLNVIGGSNTNMFKRFLHERESKVSANKQE